MVRKELVEKLSLLNVFPTTVEKSAGIFERGRTLEDIRKEADLGTCGNEQFIYFHLEALFGYDPDYKTRFLAEAQNKLGNAGIKQEHVAEYFQIGADPGLVFMFRHETEYNPDVRTTFYQRANQFALDKIREWLEIK